MVGHLKPYYRNDASTHPKTNMSHKKKTISVKNTSSNHSFSAAMLVLGRVSPYCMEDTGSLDTSTYGKVQVKLMDAQPAIN